MLAMRPTRIFETVLYAEDLAAAERFYRDAVGLEVIGRGDLCVVFRCGGGVLLIFDPRKSGAPGRDVPPTGLQAPDTLRSVPSQRISMHGGSSCVKLESLSNGKWIGTRAVVRFIFVTRRAMLSN
jgi:Predicted ring-cleavage extradiol dioxygenase